MRHSGALGRRLALVLGLVPALVVGAYLYLHDTRAAAPAPPPTTTRAAMATATASPTQPPPTATLAAIAAGTSLPTVPPTPTPTRTPTATATPAPAWVEVGRWNDDEVIFTPEFTVRGPWRIRWRLAAPNELFQLMIEEGIATPILLTSDAGTTVGVFEQARGGTFSLMLHNTIPYEVIVEEYRAAP